MKKMVGGKKLIQQEANVNADSVFAGIKQRAYLTNLARYINYIL